MLSIKKDKIIADEISGIFTRLFKFGCKPAKAFTLAEVLITLGIIGIVAAMTLPALVGKYQKNVTVAKLQKIYTSLNQALKRSEVDNGEYQDWENGLSLGTNKYYEKYWHPYFKIMKVCNTYNSCQYTSNTPWYSMDGTVATTLFSQENFRIPFLTTDGSLISISIASGDLTTPNEYIFVDINGHQKPNKYGKDVFIFTRTPKNGIQPISYESTGSAIDSSCKTYGAVCAAKIIRDGWKIKDDYPW